MPNVSLAQPKWLCKFDKIIVRKMVLEGNSFTENRKSLLYYCFSAKENAYCLFIMELRIYVAVVHMHPIERNYNAADSIIGYR